MPRFKPALKILSLLAASLAATAPAWAKPSGAPLFDPVDEELIDRLSHRPELMDLEYLEHLIGRPENANDQRFAQCTDYYWYLRMNHAVMYELHQSELFPGRVTESTFIIHVPYGRLTLAQVEAEIGVEPERFFDNTASGTILYSTAPFTSLSFSVPPGSDFVQSIRVIYHGRVLAKPTQADYDEADQRALEKPLRHLAFGEWNEAAPPLAVHLKRHPDDAEARYWFARTLVNQHRLDDAIKEYELALGSAGNNDDLRARCLADLQALRVLPDSNYNQQPHSAFFMVENGKRIRAAQPDDRYPEQSSVAQSGAQASAPAQAPQSISSQPGNEYF